MVAARWSTGAIAGAALLNLAYPPFHLFLPSFVCLAPVIVALERAAPGAGSGRRALKVGALFGLVGYGVTLHWMALGLWRHTPWWVLGFVAAVLVLAAVTALTFAAVTWLRVRTGLSTMLVFPVLWTVQEWGMAHLGPLSYTWLGLGTSLTGYPALIQVADLVGARGITFLLAAANAALALAWLHRREQARSVALLAGVVAGILAAALYGSFRIRTLEYGTVGRVAVVQTDFTAGPNQAARPAGQALGIPMALSRVSISEHPDLIVWPESSLPRALLYHPEWARSIAALARDASAFVLAGGIDGIPTKGGLQQHNAAFLFDPDGRRTAEPYHKQRLVPLVEWRGGITPGTRGVIDRTWHGRIGVLICGEATFESVARQYRRQGGDALVNPSNDAWLAGSAGPVQHAAHVVMRAIETRMGIARATNLGVSEIIDPTGRITRQVAPATAGVAVGLLRTTMDVSTYVRWGDWVGSLCGMTAVFLVILATAGPRWIRPRSAMAPARRGSRPEVRTSHHLDLAHWWHTLRQSERTPEDSLAI